MLEHESCGGCYISVGCREVRMRHLRWACASCWSHSGQIGACGTRYSLL